MSKNNILIIFCALVLLSLFCSRSNSCAEEMAAYQIVRTADIQAILKEAGSYKGPIDGITGYKTKQAVIEFQKKKGLKPDGIVGKKTRESLSKYLAEKNAKINQLSEQLSKLKKENYLYQNQINEAHEESRRKDLQLQELTQQFKREKEEYDAELAQNLKDNRELQLEYDNRLREENSRISGLVKDREYLIAEKDRLENLHFMKLRKLEVIQRELDAVID